MTDEETAWDEKHMDLLMGIADLEEDSWESFLCLVHVMCKLHDEGVSAEQLACALHGLMVFRKGQLE